jgi:3-hydroxybutyrate dehydrogenase
MDCAHANRGSVNPTGHVMTGTALRGLARAMAMEVLLDGITGNPVCPGAVHPPVGERRVRATAMGRTGDA